MNRQYWHDMLDRAMDETQEGESFVGKFVNMAIAATLRPYIQPDPVEFPKCRRIRGELKE